MLAMTNIYHHILSYVQCAGYKEGGLDSCEGMENPHRLSFHLMNHSLIELEFNQVTLEGRWLFNGRINAFC